jgi:phosphoglycerate kinase
MEEINALRTALEKPRRPVAAIVGGMKVSTKIEVLTNLVAKVDKLVIGGGMANTFLQSLGRMTGQSITEPDYHATAREIMAQAKQKNCELILPVDALVADAFAEDVDTQIVAIEKVPFDKMILDVGPKSIAHVNKVLEGCQTVLWNGPMGAFEIRKFATGTFEVAKKVAELTKAGKMVSVAGGGDTVAALNAAGVTQDFTYVSTAGGAFLEWLEGRELPGIAALTR